MVVPIRQPYFPFLFTLPAPWVLFYFQILWIQLFWIFSLIESHVLVCLWPPCYIWDYFFQIYCSMVYFHDTDE